MNITNELLRFHDNKPINLDNFYGHVYAINHHNKPITTAVERIALLDWATQLLSDMLVEDEDSWMITEFNILSEKWCNLDFNYGKTMLVDALHRDLAYSKSERLGLQQATDFQKLILEPYQSHNSFIYSNIQNNPWQVGSYSWNAITDDWTFDLAIVVLNAKQLTFCTVFSED